MAKCSQKNIRALYAISRIRQRYGQIIDLTENKGVDGIGYDSRTLLFKSARQLGRIEVVAEDVPVRKEPKSGDAFDSSKNRWASVVGMLFIPVTAVFLFSSYSSAVVLASFLYTLYMVVLPLLVSSYTDDALANNYRALSRSYPLIKGFEKAQNIWDIEDIEEDARGKISYFSYSMLRKVEEIESSKADKHKALFVEKSALSRMPRFVQWFIYLHEWLHAGYHSKVESVNVPLTYTFPWIGVSGTLLLISGFFGQPETIMFYGALFLYNTGMPFLMGMLTCFIGYHRSEAGHYLLDPKRHRALSGTEVDVVLSKHVHNTVTGIDGGKIYWRQWLRGEGETLSVFLVEVEQRPEDIIVVKGNAKENLPPEKIMELVGRSDKNKFVLIIADSDWVPGATFGERKQRIEALYGVADEAFSRMGPKSFWRSRPRITKVDVRSTLYNIGRLRDLYSFYRKRLKRLEQGKIEKEAVAPEVSGRADRLEKVLSYLRDSGYEKVVFTGDYLGKKNAFDAMMVLMDHFTRKDLPHVELVMGKAEHLFLRAMMGDRTKVRNKEGSFYLEWPEMKTLEGPAVMRAIDEMAREVEMLYGRGESLTPLQEEVRRFELCIAKVAESSDPGRTDTEEAKKTLRRAYYRYHPMLLHVADFIVHNMHFVFYEDSHHNLYLSEGVPAEFEREGLHGVSGLIRMEQEFRQNAMRVLPVMKHLSTLWMSNFKLSEGDEEETHYVEELMKIENEMADTYGELSPVVKTSFEDFMGTPFEPGTGGLEARGTVERQRREIRMGINTLFSTNDFKAEAVQDLGQVRLLTERGDLILMEVDSMDKDPGSQRSEKVLYAFQHEAEEAALAKYEGNRKLLEEEYDRKFDEIGEAGEREELTARKQEDIKKLEEKFSKDIELSMEYVTKRKLKGLPLWSRPGEKNVRGVESIVKEYDALVAGLRGSLRRRISDIWRDILSSRLLKIFVGSAVLMDLLMQARAGSETLICYAAGLPIAGLVFMRNGRRIFDRLDIEDPVAFLLEAPYRTDEDTKPDDGSDEGREHTDEDPSAFREGKEKELPDIELFERMKEKSDGHDILKGAEETVKYLAHFLSAWSELKTKENYVLAVAVPRGEDSREIRRILERKVVDKLRSLHHNNGYLRRLMENLAIISSDAETLSVRLENMAEMGEIYPENVVILTPLEEAENFTSEALEGAYLTAYDDSDMAGAGTELDYYPMVEMTLFAVLRAYMAAMSREGVPLGELEGYAERLFHFYKAIPNVMEMSSVEFTRMCFDRGVPKKKVILKLLPDVRRYPAGELVEIYTRIEEFITRA